MKTITKWGAVTKRQRFELRGLVSVPPGGLARSAEILIHGFSDGLFSYEMTLPQGRSAKRHGCHSIGEAQAEAEQVARHLLDIFAEPAADVDTSGAPGMSFTASASSKRAR
jgi:hypothetical protein